MSSRSFATYEYVRRALVWSVLATSLACSESPAVQVSTYVGESGLSEDPYASWDDAQKVFAAATAAWRPRARLEATGPHAVTHPPRTPDELARLIQELRHGPLDEIGGPAVRIAAATPDVWPAVKQALLAKRPAPKGDYRSLLAAIGGDVPNRYGTFKLAWKKAHGYPVKLSQDWLADLLALPRSKVSRGLRPVYRDCVLETALFQAAASIATAAPEMSGEVVAALLDAAYLHQGTFRDEVGRALRSVGEPAVPHLIRASIRPKNARRDLRAISVRKAEYAAVQLDRMDRLHPRKAVSAVSDDPASLGRLFGAYALARPGEAADVLLDFVDNPTPALRRAARAAFRSYVIGDAPRAVQKTVKTLGGGKKKAQAYMSYRGRATLAIRSRLEHDAPALLEPTCDVRREDGAYDRACMEQPARHLNAYVGYLDLQRRSDQSRALALALATDDVAVRISGLDRILAAGLEIDALDDLVPQFRLAADRAREAGRPARAAQLYRKSAMLLSARAPAQADRLRVNALLAEASTHGLDPRGQAMLLHTAADLDPDEPRVLSALADLRARQGPGGTPPHLWIGTVATLLALVCLGLGTAPVRKRLLSP